MPETSEQQINDITKTLEEIKRLQTQLAESPGDKQLTEKLFNLCNSACNYHIDQCDIAKAVLFLREMQSSEFQSEQATTVLGWNIFHILKAIYCDDYAKRNYQKAVPELAERFFLLKFPRPSQLHSSIIAILSKLAQERTDWFLPYIQQTGFDALQDSDFQPYSKDGKKLTPLAETLFLKCAKALEHSTNMDDHRWLLDSLERHQHKFSENQWISYYQGKLMLKLDRIDGAKRFIGEILARHKNQFWAWAVFGETFKHSDPEMYLDCLCKALSFPTESSLLLNVREELALLLHKMGFFPEAKAEIEALCTARKLLDLPIPGEIANLMKEDWYPATEANKSNLDFYLKRLPQANALLKDDSAPQPGIVTACYEATRGVFIQFDLDKVALYKYGKTSDQRTYAVGDLVTVSVQEVLIGGHRRYEALSAEPGDKLPAEEFVKQISGDLKMPQKSDAAAFGFIADIYAPPDLVKGFQNGAKVKGIAIKEFNKKRNQYGWRAIVLTADTSLVLEPAPAPNSEPAPGLINDPVTYTKPAVTTETVENPDLDISASPANGSAIVADLFPVPETSAAPVDATTDAAQTGETGALLQENEPENAGKEIST